MANLFEPPVVIQPSKTHTHTIILVHGRGSSGIEFSQELEPGNASSNNNIFKFPPAHDATKWIFPSAHERFSSVFKEEIHEWFDIPSLSNPNAKQELQKEGLKESIEYIRHLIDAEISAGIEAGNIILGGISQGFAVSVHALLFSQYQLGGFIGLCGWIPFSDFLEKIPSDDLVALTKFYLEELGLDATPTRATFATPILISHAQDDGTVESSLGKVAVEILRELGMKNIEWHEYKQGGHWISEPQGYDDIERFIRTKFGAT